MVINIFPSSLNTIFLFYTDPGSGALLLQLITAAILGGLFYFRRIKDRIFRKPSPNNDSRELNPENSENSVEK